MSSPSSRLYGALIRWLPKGIVARTTLCILGLSMLMGLTFGGLAAWSEQIRERHRAEAQLAELLSTVESTARIACYLNDRTLARELAAGLLRNDGVEAVTIIAGRTVLHQQSRAHSLPEPVSPQSGDIISRAIASPFDSSDPVGVIEVRVAQRQIAARARAYSYGVALLLGGQVALVSAAVAFVVFSFVTRPIRAISNELHQLKIGDAGGVRVPEHNRHDEIGRLVGDVNALIASLTTHLDAEHSLRMEHEMSERRMRLIVDKAETGLFVIDATGRLQSWNPALARMLSGPGREVAFDAQVELPGLLAPHADHVSLLIEEALRTGSSCDADLDLTRPDGRSHWIEISLNPIAPGLLQGVVNDITARKQVELDAQRLASHDALTGLLNRHGLMNALERLFDRPDSESAAVTVLQIDLDHFKQVNDLYGHAAGDEVLRQVAKVLEHCVRRVDLVARPGGDEFVIVLIGLDDMSKAIAIGEAIVRGVSHPIDVGDGNRGHVGASVGIAASRVADTSPQALLARADAAMYAAKQAGRGRVHVAAADDSDDERSAA